MPIKQCPNDNETQKFTTYPEGNEDLNGWRSKIQNGMVSAASHQNQVIKAC